MAKQTSKHDIETGVSQLFGTEGCSSWPSYIHRRAWWEWRKEGRAVVPPSKDDIIESHNIVLLDSQDEDHPGTVEN